MDMESNFNGPPKISVEDRIESRPYTVRSLAADFAEFAESDEEYAYKSVNFRSIKSVWINSDDVYASIEFNALHLYEDKSYQGEVYSLELIVKDEGSYLGSEFKKNIRANGYSLPDDENIRAIKIVYYSKYILSQYVTLGWYQYRKYDIFHDQDSIPGPGANVSVQCEYDEEDGDKTDTLPKYFMPIIFPIDAVNPPEISPEKELGDTYIDKEHDLMTSLEVEVNVLRAKEIFRILQEGKISELDLSSILPPESISLIKKSNK